MDTLLPLLIAGVAADAILLIFIGLAGKPSVDPVQARLTQLGTMQAKNLEELELQQPARRADAPAARRRLSGADLARREHLVHPDDREAPRARRQPGRPAGGRLDGHQGRRRASSAAWHLLPALRASSASSGCRRSCGLVLIPVGADVRLHDPRVLARRPRPQAPEGDPAPDPGRPRPADDLRPRRPRLRRRAGQGRREAQGTPDRGVPPGARGDPRRQGAARRAAGHRPADRGPGPHQLHRRDHPGRAARRLDQQGAPGPVASSCASSAASAPRRWRPRRRSRCCSRSSGASSRRCSSSSSARRSS